ncbi:unnamed protein product [Paramecium primaurelia]|uniref:Uncharacterized protein n=1 Tax=Paramecium primaurelia TaxID=5886 RepID=A0A8S1MW48_PARPR|nr:unnamed protein product [Paramecium primaurelia]
MNSKYVINIQFQIIIKNTQIYFENKFNIDIYQLQTLYSYQKKKRKQKGQGKNMNQQKQEKIYKQKSRIINKLIKNSSFHNLFKIRIQVISQQKNILSKILDWDMTWMEIIIYKLDQKYGLNLIKNF